MTPFEKGRGLRKDWTGRKTENLVMRGVDAGQMKHAEA